jgi:hypothetical protein
MTITSTERQGFVIGLVTTADSVKGQTKPLATSILLAFPRMEAGQVATSYIPTGTRAVDIITNDVAMPLFRLYGVRDFVGPMGRRGLLGADDPPGSDANVPEWVTATQVDVQLNDFGGTLAASRVTNIDYNSLINKPDVVLP